MIIYYVHLYWVFLNFLNYGLPKHLIMEYAGDIDRCKFWEREKKKSNLFLFSCGESFWGNFSMKFFFLGILLVFRVSDVVS